MNELRARGILSGGNLRPNAPITVAEIMSSFDTAFWGK